MKRTIGLVYCFALLLNSQNVVWKKQISAWTEEDAREILQHSPWAEIVTAAVAPLQNEEQRRQSGGMGLPTGIGFDGIADTRARIAIPRNIFDMGDPTPAKRSDPIIHLNVRWESALAVRAAELKGGDSGAPLTSHSGYTIVLYGIPGTFFGDPLKLGSHLNGLALISREGKKDVKPSSTEVYQLESGAAVVYTFPASTEIKLEDKSVFFQAAIGRLKVAHTFKLEEMQTDGKLQLENS